jgi:hypothetical protein
MIDLSTNLNSDYQDRPFINSNIYIIDHPKLMLNRIFYLIVAFQEKVKIHICINSGLFKLFIRGRI